jgi:hypothetical protein
MELPSEFDELSTNTMVLLGLPSVSKIHSVALLVLLYWKPVIKSWLLLIANERPSDISYPSDSSSGAVLKMEPSLFSIHSVAVLFCCPVTNSLFL